ncbi:MAG: elongation factor P [Candidatus Wildermuthbacteria bacterium]|nr:elongation factor P [Candidatus Wildermuthbacteria bacterium]
MLTHIDLKRGIRFVIDGQPYEVLDHSIVFKGRGSAVMQTKIRNMKTGGVLNRTFHTGETFEEAELQKIKIKFIYASRGSYVFSDEENPKQRFELTKEQVGNKAKYFIPDTILEGLVFQDAIIDISLPVKMNFKVAQTPPGVKGDRAQSGTKTATLETGAVVQVPLFVEQDDTVEVNTETDEYVRRV